MKITDTFYREWALKMALGFVCYWVVMAVPVRWLSRRVFLWLYGWAGFYANDIGHEFYAEAVALKEKE